MHCAFCLFFPFLAANSLFSGTQRVDIEKERTNVNIEHNLVVLNSVKQKSKAILRLLWQPTTKPSIFYIMRLIKAALV